jgi:hypothetical protein
VCGHRSAVPSHPDANQIHPATNQTTLRFRFSQIILFNYQRGTPQGFPIAFPLSPHVISLPLSLSSLTNSQNNVLLSIGYGIGIKPLLLLVHTQPCGNLLRFCGPLPCTFPSFACNVCSDNITINITCIETSLQPVPPLDSENRKTCFGV